MKRNWDLVREILLKVEALPPDPANLVDEKDFEDRCSTEEFAYHVRMMHDAGFLYADSDEPYWWATDLTWQGHEFLETIKNEPVWKKLLERLKSTGKTVPMEVVSKFGADILVQWLSKS